MSQNECCKKINACVMILTALLCLSGSVLIWFGGLSIYQIGYQQSVDDGTEIILYEFVSCADKFKTNWNNATSKLYIKSDLVRAFAYARCGVMQMTPVFLTAVAGLFVFGTGIAGFWAACKGSRGAVFSSGISIGFTVAVLVTCIGFIVPMFAQTAIQFVNCAALNDQDYNDVKAAGLYCWKGWNGVAVVSLEQFVTGTVAFTTGLVISLVAMFLMKFTSTVAYHYNQEVVNKGASQDASASLYTAPMLPYPESSAR